MAALAFPAFRRLWIGHAASMTGQSMQLFAMGWLIVLGGAIIGALGLYVLLRVPALRRLGRGEEPVAVAGV